MIHKLRLVERFADDIYTGARTFDVRRSDRNFERGDIVVYSEVYDEDGDPVTGHAISDLRYRITSLLYGFGIGKGHVAFSIEEIDDGC